MGSRKIVTDVEGHQDVSLSVDGSFKDAFIIWIRQQRTPLKIGDNKPELIANIQHSLQQFPVTLILGPRQCGKITLARMVHAEAVAPISISKIPRRRSSRNAPNSSCRISVTSW